MGFVFTGPKSSRQDIKPVVTPQIIKAEEPKKKSKFWGITKYIMSGASNVITSVPDAYKGVKNYISNTQKDLAPPVIDPALHWNLYNQGKTNELTNLESSGVVVPKLVSPPPGVSPLTPQEQDYYSNKVLNDMTKDRVIKEDREASILETGGWQAKDDEYYKTISQDRLEETKELVRDRKAKNLSKDILNAYQLGGYPVDKKLVENLENRMLEIVDTDSLTYQDMSDVYHFPKLTKRTDVSGPNYPEVFAQRAKEAFTSGILESNVEPETTGEEIAATLGDLAGMVTSLWLTGGTLKGAALLTKTGQTFQKTAPYLFELSKSVGAFNIHGQLRPELMGDWAARMDTATMDTSMALFFGGSSAMFPGMAGIPVTAGVFGGLSYLNGDPKEIVITNALAGGMLHGMGFMKPKVGRQILNNNAKKTLERYSDTKLKNGYTNAEINAVESLSKKRLLKDGYIDEVDAVTRSAQHLRAIAPEKRAFTSPGSPYNNLKKTIREVGEEFKALTKTKEKINLEPAVMGDIMRATQPGKPKVVDSVRVVIGDMKTQPLQKETLKFLRSVEGKESYLKRVEELKKDFSKATGKARKIIGGHIDALVAVGKQLGYEGYRITDIKRKFTETDIQLREGEIGIAIEGLAKRSVDSLELSGNAKVNEMSVIRKGISDIANDLNINERVVATEFLRRFMEMDTGRTAYKEYIKNSDIDNILNVKPVDDVVVSLKVKAVPEKEVPKKLKKIKGFAQEPIEKTVEAVRKGIGTLKDATERSKLIEDAIRKEYPKASDKQIKLLKKVVGKLLTGKKDFATAIKEVGELTQKEIVKAVVSEKPKSIKEVAKETKILEPNVRRIFGVGEKEGTFERVEKGVYILSKDGKDMAYIHPGDALEILPKLAKKKIKADMIFLDIPYKTPAVVGGNRGVKYGLIEPSQFKTVVDSLLKMTRTKDTPILYMYSNAVSGKKEMSKFNDILLDNFKPIARGSYAKLTKAGKPFGFPTPSGWKPLAPEGIILASVSGKLDPAIKSIKDANLKFAFNRPKGWQSEKPKEMLEEMIKMTTKEGDMVFDPFAGSGVTGEQAIKAGRKTRLIEKSEEAVKKHIKPRIKKALEESPKQKVRELAKEEVKEVKQVLRKAKGLSADDIVKKNPDINLKRDVPIRDIHGNKRIIPEGEALTPYELKGNKVLLQDGETYIVSKNQYENIKGQSIKGEAKEFAPELKETKETVKGEDIPEEEIQRLLNDEVGQGMTRKGAIEYLKKEEGYIDITGTKFDEYQLPGGKNYKEILIQAPTDAQKRLESIGYEFRDLGDGRIEIIKNDGRIGTANSLTEAVNKRISLEPSLKNIFKSPHFTEPNILAWARTNVRKYKNKAVLFIEEIQSDWASEGRKRGFATDISFEKANKNAEDYLSSLYKKYESRNMAKVLDDLSTKAEHNKYRNLVDIANKAGAAVPANKLLKNWQELAIKRALKETVDTNAEYMSWITGDQTSARYNLATYLNSVKWVPQTNGKKLIYLDTKQYGKSPVAIDKKGVIIPYDKSNAIGLVRDMYGKKLNEVFGKGLADKIMSEKEGKLSGEGLKFGGDWAENLYDKQIPNIVKDITRVRPEVIDMGLMIEPKRTTFIKQSGKDIGGAVTKEDLKIGLEINKEVIGDYIITDVIGNGKFKAVRRDDITTAVTYKLEDAYEFYQGKYKNLTDVELFKKFGKDIPEKFKEIFDIFTKKSAGQQAIKITPAIQALVKGEAPPMKKPSGVSPLEISEGIKKKLFEKVVIKDSDALEYAKRGRTVDVINDIAEKYRLPEGKERIDILAKRLGDRIEKLVKDGKVKMTIVKDKSIPFTGQREEFKLVKGPEKEMGEKAEVWQMTREEFKKNRESVRGKNVQLITKKEEKYIPTSELTKEITNKTGIQDLYTNNHKLFVAKALIEGKNISERVLKEYPDLVALIKGVSKRPLGEDIIKERGISIGDSIEKKTQKVIDNIEADSYTKQNMQEFLDTLHTFKNIDTGAEGAISRLEKIKKGIEADNFTRENIDDLIKFIRTKATKELPLAQEVFDGATIKLTPKLAKYLSYSVKRYGEDFAKAKRIINSKGEEALVGAVLDNGRMMQLAKDGKKVRISSSVYDKWRVVDVNLEDVPKHIQQTIKPKVQTAAPKPLIQEARKYKSAEEFEKNLGNIFKEKENLRTDIQKIIEPSQKEINRLANIEVKKHIQEGKKFGSKSVFETDSIAAVEDLQLIKNRISSQLRDKQITDFYNQSKGITITQPLTQATKGVEKLKVQPSAPKPKTKPPTKEELGKVDQFVDMPHKNKLYTGIDPGIGVFWNESLSPGLKSSVSNIKDAAEGIVNIFAPAAKTEGTRLTASVIRKGLSEFARKKDMGAKLSEEIGKWWDKNTDKIRDEFLYSEEGGKLNKYIEGISNPADKKVLQALMDNYRERYDKTYEISKNVDEQIGYTMNYVSHIWKDGARAKKIFGDWQMVIGKEKFANKRTIDFIKKGREMGLELVTNNPEELVLMREISAWQAKSQLDIINELSSLGLLKSPMAGSKLSGYQQLKTPYGVYSMPGDVARVVHNWLKPRLWADPGLKGKTFRTAMQLKNASVAGLLGLSAFHMVETGISALSAQSMIAARRLFKLDVPGFINEAGRVFSTLPKDVGFPFISKGKGGAIIDAWFNKPKYEWQQEAVDLMIRSGGRPLMASDWRVGAIRGWKKAIRRGNIISAFGRSFPALLETMAIPMFDYWVPRMKTASFYKLSKDYIVRHPEVTGRKLDMELGKIWDSTDNRFGQMVYDNLFWDPKLRDAGTLMTLSMGWQLGTSREFGGAAFIDTPKVLKQLALKITKDPKLKVEITDRMLYTAMYTMWFGMLGATLTYGMTGNWPTNLIDYFYPKTGEKNSDGTDARLQMPTMLKEMFRAEKVLSKYGLAKGTVRMIKNKQAPILGSIWNIWENKDFYGTEISDPNDPMVKRALDITKFMASANFVPISIKEWMEMNKDDESTPLAFFGFVDAPSYITQTKIAAEISKLYERRIGGPTISAEERRKREAKTEIRNKFRKNKLTIKDVEKALADGTLTESGLNEFFRRAALPSDVRLFSALGAEDQHALLLKMKQTFSELGRYLPEAKKAVKEKWGLNTD